MAIINMKLPSHEGSNQSVIVDVDTVQELAKEIKLFLTINYLYRTTELIEHSRTYGTLIAMHHDYVNSFGLKGVFPEDEELVRVAKEAIAEYGPQVASKADVDNAIEIFDSITF